jgi:hypothetical protein
MSCSSNVLARKCDHRAELINNNAFLGSDYYMGAGNTEQSLKTLIKCPYKYVLFPIGESITVLRYISFDYNRWEGMHPILVGGFIYPNQAHTRNQNKPVWKYTEGISMNPDQGGWHGKFYKDVWKHSNIASFAPIRHSFESKDVVCTQIEFANFSHLILYLNKYEHYMKLRNEDNQKTGEFVHFSPFPIPIELFMLNEYNINITPFNKYSILTNINGTSQSDNHPWKLKTLCCFFLKNYYTEHMNKLKGVLPTRLFNQLQCTQFASQTWAYRWRKV